MLFVCITLTEPGSAPELDPPKGSQGSGTKSAQSKEGSVVQEAPTVVSQENNAVGNKATPITLTSKARASVLSPSEIQHVFPQHLAIESTDGHNVQSGAFTSPTSASLVATPLKPLISLSSKLAP